MVPRRAFADEDAFREFVETAGRYRNAARHAQAEHGASGRKSIGEPDTSITPEERADR